MSVIAVANQKGGVGKTTTVLNLGASLAERGQRVLLIDMDPQAHLSLGLGLDIYASRPTLYNVFCADVALASVVLPTGIPGLDLAPSSLQLYAVETRFAVSPLRACLLRDRLFPILAQGRYDYVLLDCMSTLGVLTTSALAAADWVLLPVQTAFYAVEALTSMLATLEFVQNRLNYRLRVVGILPTFYDGRTRQSAAALEGLRGRHGSLVLNTIVRRTVKLDEAPSRGQSILRLAPSSPAARAYRQLAQEVLARAGGSA